MPRDLSIIVVTYNSAGEIVACLEPVVKQIRNSESVEIIVVDNASADGTVDIIHKQLPGVILIQNEQNTGFAKAVNRGASVSSGKLLLLLNPDTVPNEDFLQTVFQFSGQHPEAGIIGWGLKDADGRRQPSCWKSPDAVTVFLEMFLPYRAGLYFTADQPEQVREVEVVSGACMIIRKNIFDELHGFDERFFMYYEDFDFCIRARNAGTKVFFNPEHPVVHHLAKSSWKDKRSFFMRIYRSRLQLFRKHSSVAFLCLICCIIVTGLSVRIISYAAAGCLLFNMELLRLAKYHTLVLLSFPKLLKSS